MAEPRRRGTDPARARVVREVELKVGVPEDLVLPPLIGGLPGISLVRELPPVVLGAAYHDTADRRLTAAGVSLRRREGGHDAGWHLKLPAPAGETGRDEVRLPLVAGAVGEVPGELADLVVPLVREAPLLHLAGVRTERRTWELVDGAGEVLAEVVDDRVRLEPSGARLRQVEVEARVTDTRAGAVLDAVVARLVGAGGTVETLTKSGAALGPSARPGIVEVPEVPSPDDPAAALVRQVLARGVRAFLLAELDVRRSAPDAVHRMRVAARTLRSQLRTFAPLLDEDWAARLRAGLRESAGAWGAARDLEVQIGHLLAAAGALPPSQGRRATRAVRDALVPRERAALDDARATLGAERHLALLVALAEAARSPRVGTAAGEPIAEVVPPLVALVMRRLRRSVAGLALDGPAETWHRTRVLAKRARYAADAVAPVLPRAAGPARDLAVLTDLLGQAQDAVVGRGLLLALADDVDGPTGYALGLLTAGLGSAEEAARRAVLDAWPQIEPSTRRAMR